MMKISHRFSLNLVIHYVTNSHPNLQVSLSKKKSIANRDREQSHMAIHQNAVLPVINCISTQDKLYVCSNRYQSHVGFNQKGKWNYSTQVAEEILNLLNIKQFHSIREIASVYGKSRQLIFVYLEALASIDMVGIDCSGYKVLSKERILKLGTYIQPGILGKMRIESGIKPKPWMRKTAASAYWQAANGFCANFWLRVR